MSLPGETEAGGPGLPRAPAESGLFANANSFSGALHEVRFAARFRLSVAGVRIPEERSASAGAAGGDGANGKARMGF
jgi:hypothetical protein